jgi:hypothetical protein
MGVKHLLTFLLFLCSALGLSAASPSFTDMFNALKWTNSVDGIYPKFASPISAAPNSHPPALISAYLDTNNVKELLSLAYYMGGNNNPNTAYRLEARNSANPATPFTGQLGTGLIVQSFLTNKEIEVLYEFGGNIAIWGDADKLSGTVGEGQGIGVLGSVAGGYAIQYGTVGFAYGQNENSTNVGVAGVGIGNPAKMNAMTVGGYFEAQKDWVGGDPHFENSIVLADSRDTGHPLFIARTNNGTFKAFEIHGTKTTNATPLDVLGLTTLYGNWRVPDTNGLGGFINFTASTNSGSAVLTVSGSPGSSTVRTNGNGFVFNTPGASDFSFVKGVTSNLTILGVATLNITNGIIIGISGP